MRYPLDESGSAVVGGNGRARVDIGPAGLAQEWSAAWATVQSESALPTFAILSGPGGNGLGATRSGNQDTTDLPDIVLKPGQRLTAEWFNGTPGARCTLMVYGTVSVRGR